MTEGNSPVDLVVEFCPFENGYNQSGDDCKKVISNGILAAYWAFSRDGTHLVSLGKEFPQLSCFF